MNSCGRLGYEDILYPNWVGGVKYKLVSNQPLFAGTLNFPAERPGLAADPEEHFEGAHWNPERNVLS
jgi:hypothetical protein